VHMWPVKGRVSSGLDMILLLLYLLKVREIETAISSFSTISCAIELGPGSGGPFKADRDGCLVLEIRMLRMAAVCCSLVVVCSASDTSAFVISSKAAV